MKTSKLRQIITANVMRSLGAGVLLAAGAFIVPLSAQTNATNLRIVVNSAGFLPGYPKTASVRNVSGNGGTASTFTVRRADNNSAAYSDTLGPVIKNIDTPDSVRIADFSEFDEPGRYYVEYGEFKSPEFDIGPNAFREVYRTLMLGMYLWRCGHPGGVNASHTHNGTTRNYSHGQCHMEDGKVLLSVNTESGWGITLHPDQVGETKDGTGGWHDAGDFNKYITNSGKATGIMLKAWEHHGHVLDTVALTNVNRTGGIPAYLTEVKWNLDWMSKMQLSDGRVHHKLTALNFGEPMLPSSDVGARYFIDWSTGATASFAGTMALAARLYKEYDQTLSDKWLDQAKSSYEILKDSINWIGHNRSLSQTGEYEEDEILPNQPKTGGNDNNKRMWAAVELWETTGGKEYLDDFEERANRNLNAMKYYVTWQDLSSMAMATYLLSERTGKDPLLVAELETRLKAVADQYVSNVNSHGYARVFGSDAETYHWGNNGSLAAITYILNTAFMVTGEKKYRDAGHEVIGHLLGRNYFGRSFVTGVGHNPPANTHCRRSMYNGYQWPGYLVGGPNSEVPNLIGGRCNVGGTIMPGVCYFDEDGDYARNEIAINWNGSMIYAVSGFLADIKAEEPIVGTVNPAASRAARNRTKVTRMISVKNGHSSVVIPPGAKIYSLDGRLVAQRRIGDASAPVIRRNGMFIMKVDGK